MFALISENSVVEIAEEKFPVAQPLRWVKCNESVKVGWVYCSKKFKKSLKSDEELLDEARKKKAEEIKAIRDQKNIEPIIGNKAFLIDESGKKTKKTSDFLFHTNRHRTNPVSDSVSIISRALELGAMPYFTKDNAGNKIVIELTSTIAATLSQSISERNDSNYRICFATEVAIGNATTIEEVEAITWNENI